MKYLFGDWEQYRCESQLDEVFISILNDNPVSTIIDMEDKEYLDAPVVLDKFFMHSLTQDVPNVSIFIFFSIFILFSLLVLIFDLYII